MEKPRSIPQELREPEPINSSLNISETEFEGSCEDCGPYTDRRILIALNGEEMQTFFDDDHKGDEQFDTRDVEDYIIELLSIPVEELVTLAVAREQLEKELEEVLDADEPDWEKEAQLIKEQETSFYTFLRGLGHNVTYTKEVQNYEDSYREEDYYEEFEYEED